MLKLTLIFCSAALLTVVTPLDLARPQLLQAMQQLQQLEQEILLEEALVDQGLESIQDTPENRFFQQIASLLGPKGNLGTIVANAPNGTASLAFVPAVTLLAASSGTTGTTGTTGLGGLGGILGGGTGGVLGGLGGTGGILGGLGG